ncbi:MAG: hypothetical protein LBS60_07380 [Deltaproteobacteria bacterium]|jgi:tetrahydromethanopterin S-methyltransferase subunit B|nr:hypothetical protein [Deltaproteobacteria bacterium]
MLGKVEDQLKDVSGTVGDLRVEVKTLNAKIDDLEKSLAKIYAKIDGLEKSVLFLKPIAVGSIIGLVMSSLVLALIKISAK